MDRKYILFTGVILIAAVMVGGVFLVWSMKPGAPPEEPSPSPTPIASPVASPRPSPSPSPVVNPLETKSDLEQIKEAFAEKYNKQLAEITVTIDESTGTYANGGVKFEGEIGGAWWLAYNDGTGWIIVADGNGSVMCADVENYNFPTSMVPECWDEDTNTLIQL
ncbi:hypothetical protein GTN66_05880 [bacterium]|nr:hypothetical protein [bacterium]NIO73929.1 hypothetical protein [bacterium]